MAYKITKKITPNPLPETALADVEAWKTAYGSYHGSQAPCIDAQEWTLHSDGKSMIVALTYEDKDTCDKHQATEPEDYTDQYDIEGMGEATV